MVQTVVMEQETAWSRWVAIEVQHKLIGLFSAILVIFAAAIFVRPENSVTRFWLNEFSVQADWVVWVFILASMLMPLAWYLWRNLAVVALCASPLLISMVILFMQLATSTTAPLFHGAMSLSVVLLAIMCFYLARELSIYKTIAEQAIQAEE